MATMKWTEARDKTIQKWRELRVIAGVYSRRAFMERATEICALCQTAQTLAEMEHGKDSKDSEDSKDSKDSKDRCPYCLGYIQYGGCQGLINELASATLDADWDKVRSIIDDAIEFLKRLNIPDQPDQVEISNPKDQDLSTLRT